MSAWLSVGVVGVQILYCLFVGVCLSARFTPECGYSHLALQAVNLTVVAASPADVVAIQPDVIGAGTSPELTLTLNPGGGATQAMAVGWSVDGSCAEATLEGVLSVAAGSGNAPWSVAVAHPVPLSTAGITYTTCFNLGGATGNPSGWVVQASAGLAVTNATQVSIQSVSPSLVTFSAAPTLTLVGAVATPTTMIAFAESGGCGSPLTRFGATAMTSPGPLTLSTALNIGGSYAALSTCYSVDDGLSWVEQTSPNAAIEVTAECSTLVSCGECHANRFCAFCLTTGRCSLASEAGACPLVADLVTTSDDCPKLSAIAPASGDASGGTVVAVAVDYLAVWNKTALLSCRWEVGAATIESPFAPGGGPYDGGSCVSPPRLGAAPAAALTILFDDVPYSPDILFFVYYDCRSTAAASGCSDCVVRGPECGFCLADLSCGAQRNCAGATAGAPWTKEACPRVDAIVPPAVNYRGGVEVVLEGVLFVDAAEDLFCAFRFVRKGGGGCGGCSVGVVVVLWTVAL